MSLIISQCVYCGIGLTATTLTIDHVIPTYRGGSNQRNNKAPACTVCNSDKGHLTAAEYLAVRDNRAELTAMKRRVTRAATAAGIAYPPAKRPKMTAARRAIVAEQETLRLKAAARFREEVPPQGRVRWAVEQDDGKVVLGPWVDVAR